MMPRKTLLAALLAPVVALALLGCHENTHLKSPFDVLSAPTLTCSVVPPTVGAGSTQPVLVAISLDRDGATVSGLPVGFSVIGGQVIPAQVVSGFDGTATTNFFPSTVPGTAFVTATVTAGGDAATATCSITVTPSTVDPFIHVTIDFPSVLAAVRVTVNYSQGLVSLPEDGGLAAGNFATADCISLINDNPAFGMAILDIACQDERNAAGTTVATFAFENISGIVLNESHFVVSCTGWDVEGTLVSTDCTHTIF